MGKSTSSANDPVVGPTRYEFRVWGKHRGARKQLEKLAHSSTTERFEDCYLLADDPSYNAKVRDNVLKIKELVDEDKGFEQWSSGHHRSAESAPSPERTRYRIGPMRAEGTDRESLDTGQVLHTLSIDGDDLDELKALRKKLGVRNEPNIAVHQVIFDEVS